MFEFQVLSSLLHVLEVDKQNALENSSKTSGLAAAYAQSGMNFGNIAVFTCTQSCDISMEDFVVVQDSVDDAPSDMNPLPQDKLEPTIVSEGTHLQCEDGDDDEVDSGVDGIDGDDTLMDEDFVPMDENDTRF